MAVFCLAYDQAVRCLVYEQAVCYLAYNLAMCCLAHELAVTEKEMIFFLFIKNFTQQQRRIKKYVCLFVCLKAFLMYPIIYVTPRLRHKIRLCYKNDFYIPPMWC